MTSLQPIRPDCDRLDISTDRSDAFYLWKERWDDYVLMSQLRLDQLAIQLASLRARLFEETRTRSWLRRGRHGYAFLLPFTFVNRTLYSLWAGSS